MDAPVNGVMSPTGRTGSSRSACPCRGSAVDPFARSRLISTRWRVWIRHPPVSTPERPEPLNGGRRLPATRENTVTKTRSWQLMNVRDCALRAARRRSPDRGISSRGYARRLCQIGMGIGRRCRSRCAPVQHGQQLVATKNRPLGGRRPVGRLRNPPCCRTRLNAQNSKVKWGCPVSPRSVGVRTGSWYVLSAPAVQG